jgi:hypothetical protein
VQVTKHLQVIQQATIPFLHICDKCHFNVLVVRNCNSTARSANASRILYKSAQFIVKSQLDMNTLILVSQEVFVWSAAILNILILILGDTKKFRFYTIGINAEVVPCFHMQQQVFVQVLFNKNRQNNNI